MEDNVKKVMDFIARIAFCEIDSYQYEKFLESIKNKIENELEWLTTRNLMIRMKMKNKNLLKKKTCKLWVARDKSGELCIYNTKPERDYVRDFWCSDLYFTIFPNLFPELTWKDEPIEVELRPAITDLDTKAKEYANSVTDNKEIKELIINAYKAGYNE